MSEAVRIRAIAAGGDGVGALSDGRTVFVPRSAPGDVVELTSVIRAKRFARARVGRFQEASPDRVLPRCPHYDGDDCGGCQLQHVSAPVQRAAKGQLVADALRRIGHQEVVPPPVTPSDIEWEYRAKITLAAKGRRIGYHKIGRPDQVFDLERCHIARPELSDLWTAMRRQRSLLPANTEHVVLRVDRSGARHAIIRVRGSTSWTRAGELGKALTAAGVPAVLWWQPEGGAARTVAGAREAYPVMVFEQVHPVMGDLVRAQAVDALGDISGRHVWDLYAGIGETTMAIAARGATVESVELDRRAVSLAEARGPTLGVVRHAGRVEEALDRLTPADAVIANPPRTGLGEAVTDRLNARPPARLVYVSCDPATLARDVGRIQGSFRITIVRAFDLFPQTAHVETILVAERR